MRFISTVNPSFNRKRFASPGVILTFTFMACVILFIFFPKDDLLSEVRQQQHPSYLTENYLSALLSVYPNDAPLRLSLAKQQVGLGDLTNAMITLRPIITMSHHNLYYWQARWLQYQILQQQTFALKPGSRLRVVMQQHLRESLKRLVNAPLAAQQLGELAQAALEMKMYANARKLYLNLLRSRSGFSPQGFVRAAKVALALGDYQISAKLYFLAQDHSSTLPQQRQYFIQALKTLRAGNLLDEALHAARVHMNKLANDRQTLAYLTRLALAANRPKQAQVYVKQAIQLRPIVFHPVAGH